MDGAESLLGDCDTGWHIRTGEWILAHHGVPTHDLFSFSKPGAPWFAWEWLSDVLLAWLNGLRRTGGGGPGRRAAAGASRSLCCSGWRAARPIRSLRLRGHRSVAAAASSVHWLARPHLFTLLFAVLFYAVLERVREGRTRIGGRAVPACCCRWPRFCGPTCTAASSWAS